MNKNRLRKYETPKPIMKLAIRNARYIGSRFHKQFGLSNFERLNPEE